MGEPPTTNEPAPKRAKTGTNRDVDPDAKALCITVWDHFCAYLDSTEESDGGGDTDELMEIRKLLQQSKKDSILPLSCNNDDDDDAIPLVKQCADLLPVLWSVSAHLLADEAIAELLAMTDNKDSNSNSKEDCTTIAGLRNKIHRLLEEAIHYFPCNPASWSMAANYGRMTLGSGPQLLKDPETVATWYNHAVHCASRVRAMADRLLEEEEDDERNDGDDDDDDENSPNVKEWVETLLMNQILGVEWILNDDEDEAAEEDLGDEDSNDDEDEGNEENNNGTWSSSATEGTARFMAAMQYSTAGRHDHALQHLKKFPLTHRLHPNLWMSATSKAKTIKDTESPVVLVSSNKEGEGVLPQDLYKRLCKLFEPTAPYWTESGYSGRGYYSYFMDQNLDSDKNPSNLIYEVIEDHLLPLVQQKLEKPNEICGYEWWVHTRPIGANLGHNLHFDTDEALLSQEGKVTHPIYSSVLYLTGENEGGATVVLDQTPDSKQVAPRAWKNVPQNNSFLIFPGNLLHGVLPCSSSESMSVASEDNGANVPRIADLETKPATGGNPQTGDSHRLTFMVGFWTRRVPDKMKEQKLYGPCGALPPSTLEHSWVQAIQKGYADGTKSSEAATSISASPVPSVAPVWEIIQGRDDDDVEEKEPPLKIPHAIDHRFFVTGAPECFRASLFEDIECSVPDEGKE